MKKDPLEREILNRLSSNILDAAITVHREIGPGLLESVYQHCMVKELQDRQLLVNTMVPVALHYKGVALNKEYIIDILVEDEIILELKANDALLPVHQAQLLSYLKLANKRLGLLINFNVSLLKQGFRRFVNKF
ncbi:MAG TPA: GxxExxY protein [Chryseosolibacter sp.]|jgi:GxxExxY protein|nr:GxxExxY protein [Chryseosolibacter sp.]